MARIRTGREAGIIECHSNGHLSPTCKEVIDMSYKSVKSEISKSCLVSSAISVYTNYIGYYFM